MSKLLQPPARGRRKPYSQTGIRRVACWRCRNRASEQQWQICSDGRVFRPLCIECDIEMNALVLSFMRFGKRAQQLMMKRYRAKLQRS